jgi:UDP-N-acetylmuramoyl-tripeptide--D-alanyl-D-alanine ligase
MLTDIYKAFLNSSGVSTDTRTIEKDAFFVALKGGNFNGNLYAKQALESGAKYVLVDDKNIYKKEGNEQYILVDDCLTALQELANHHRKKMATPIIGITGTNGKTTTKELCKAVLETAFNVFATPGNLNNHIGVPLSLLQINAKHDVAIIEMGANHAAEIGELCAIAEPDFGIITNIGKAHLEGFGNQETILKTKKELFDWIVSKKGEFFYLQEEENIHNFAKGYYKSRAFSSQNESATFPFKIIPGITSSVKMENEEISSNLFGDYNANNIAAAISLGLFFNISIDKIKTGIQNYYPANNRSQIIKGKNTLIVDAYNANPTSMLKALQSFVQMDSEKEKWVIIGDMFELGQESEKEHESILAYLDQNTNSEAKIFLVGEHFHKHQSKFSEFNFFKNREDLEKYLEDFKEINNKLILLKASRGIKLEKIIPYFS